MTCVCDWPDECNGSGFICCDGCGGDSCVCPCGGESECFGCPACDAAEMAELDAEVFDRDEESAP